MTSRAAALPSPSPLEASAGLGWLILLPLSLLVAIQIMLAASGGVSGSAGGFADPDAYMRLLRVQHLAEGGAWSDPRFPRINPPEGHVQHWTRPLDLMLLAGAGLVQPLVGLERAIWLAGMLVSPLLLIASLGALNWACSPLLDREARLLACFIFLLQPLILAYSSIGRADHHSLLLLLFIMQLGLAIRCLGPDRSRRYARLAGAVAALAIWVSTEALLPAGVSLLAFGLAWLRGEADAERIRDFSAAAAMTLFLAVLVERGAHDPFAVENDRISIVHVALFAFICVFWQAERFLQRGLRARLDGRLAFAGAATFLTALVMAVAFPELRTGPLGQVDPVYHDLRLVWIVEIQPLVPADWVAKGSWGRIAGRVLPSIGLALALPLLLLWLWRQDRSVRRAWLPVGLALLVFLPLTVHQVRWGLYAQALLVVPYALLLRAGLDWLAGTLAGARLRAVRVIVVAIGFGWPVTAAVAFPPPSTDIAGASCRMPTLAAALNALSERPATIMTLADHGPELLYRTRHSVLSIPNHRPQPGFRATARALGATDDARSLAILERHGVGWVLLCGGGAEEAFFARAADGRGNSLYQRLRDGRHPEWLRPVPLPLPDAASVRLFAVTDGPGGRQ